jgi:8-oxo-dGTP pyrophosphatase MutT (NUDIX family)
VGERFRVCVAVYGVLRDGGRVLLMRRAGSGYRDGQLALPAGHLDGGEDAVSGLVRELAEEIGVAAERGSCRLATVLHSAPEDADDEEYLHLFFTVGAWTGIPWIREPDRCTELLWADPADLPADTIDYLPQVLAAIADGTALLLANWPTSAATAPAHR